MSHKHEWQMMPCSFDMSIGAICKNIECEAEINCDEIERRLNALEQAQTKIKHLRIEMEPFMAQIDQRKVAGLYEYD